jgi:hypothetical protein
MGGPQGIWLHSSSLCSLLVILRRLPGNEPTDTIFGEQLTDFFATQLVQEDNHNAIVRRFSHREFEYARRQINQGKALRRGVPRGTHADLKGLGSRSAVAILAESDPDRVPELIPERYKRMTENSFAFLRGATAHMSAFPHCAAHVRFRG